MDSVSCGKIKEGDAERGSDPLIRAITYLTHPQQTYNYQSHYLSTLTGGGFLHLHNGDNGYGKNRGTVSATRRRAEQ